MGVRRAFIVVGQWPLYQLTDIGKLTYLFSGGTEGHVGIFIPCCTPAEVEAHSKLKVSEPSARGAKHVTFDYMWDKFPRFQASTNSAYWTPEAMLFCYPILGVDAADVHRACLEAADIRPYNHGLYRINGLLGGCWPCSCWPSNTPLMAQSTCVALTMRIIARAKSKSLEPFTSDAETLRVLGIPSWSCSNPWGAGALVGFRPRGALEAMQQASVVGRPVEGFKRAAEACGKNTGNEGMGLLPALSLSTSRCLPLRIVMDR